MSLLIRKVIKLYFNKYKNKYYKRKIIFILPNINYVELIKKIYIEEKKKKYGIIPNIFLTQKEFIKKISKLDIVNNFYLFKILFNKIKYNNEILNISLYKIIKWIYILLYDFNIIDIELINIKDFFNYNISYYNINKLYYNNINNIFINNWEYIYKCYKILKKNILIKKKSYIGLAKRITLLNLINFKKKYYFIFIDYNFIYNVDLEIIKIIYNNKLGSFYFNFNKPYLYDKYNEINFYYKKLKKNLNNKINYIFNNYKNKKFFLYKSLTNIEKFKITGNIIKNKKLYYKNTGIILTNNINSKLLLNYISTNINNINYNLLININDIILNKFFNSIFELNIKKKNEKK
ncbi:MAG: hypothetical protein NHF93_00935 [Candidatus Shikimatogenerans bostrichidophilus]|nr:MAG: hypothetical protein NHF93_00935 [Candidatus Shikimatogenerans bostrichidophilus]